MKKRNQFASLPQQDRQLILDLCSRHSYDDVGQILRRPRAEGGLDIRTSPSALCRFYTTTPSDLSEALATQFAVAAHIRHDQTGNAFLGAIRASVECRLLENIRSGLSLTDLGTHFKILKTIWKLYLDDLKWRTNNSDRPAYNAFIQTCAEASDQDFVPLDSFNAPPAAELSARGTAPKELTPFQHDVIEARRERQSRSEMFKRILSAATHDVPRPAHARENADIRSKDPSDAEPSNATGADHQPPPNPAENPQKGPVISDFPLNSTDRPDFPAELIIDSRKLG